MVALNDGPLRWYILLPALMGCMVGPALVAVSYYHPAWSWVAWVAFSPIPILMRTGHSRIVTLCGASLAGAGLHAVAYAFMLDVFGGFFAPIWFLVSLLGGIVCGVIALIAVPMFRWPSIPAAVVFPIAWVGFEYVRDLVFEHFDLCAFAHAGVCLVPRHSVAQVADIGGIYFLSCLVACVNGALADIVCVCESRNRARRIAVHGIGVAACAFTVAWLDGAFRLSQHDAGQNCTIALVGSKIHTTMDPSAVAANVTEMLARQPCANTHQKVDLFVWPEGAFDRSISTRRLADGRVVACRGDPGVQMAPGFGRQTP